MYTDCTFNSVCMVFVSLLLPFEMKWLIFKRSWQQGTGAFSWTTTSTHGYVQWVRRDWGSEGKTTTAVKFWSVCVNGCVLLWVCFSADGFILKKMTFLSVTHQKQHLNYPEVGSGRKAAWSVWTVKCEHHWDLFTKTTSVFPLQFVKVSGTA